MSKTTAEIARSADLTANLEIAAWHGRDLANALRGAQDVSREDAVALAAKHGLGSSYAALASRNRWDAETAKQGWSAFEAAFIDRMIGTFYAA